MSERTVEIKINPAYHDRAPENVQEDLSWPVLDTVWDMIREAAAKVALQQIRESLPDNATMPTDEEILDSLDRDCPCGRTKHTMLDLSPDSLEGSMGVAAAFGSQLDSVKTVLAALIVADTDPEAGE